jgi:hypothetical protein
MTRKRRSYENRLAISDRPYKEPTITRQARFVGRLVLIGFAVLLVVALGACGKVPFRGPTPEAHIGCFPLDSIVTGDGRTHAVDSVDICFRRPPRSAPPIGTPT